MIGGMDTRFIHNMSVSGVFVNLCYITMDKGVRE